MKTLDDLRNDIVALDSADLSAVLDLAVAESRRRRAEDNRKKAILFRPGQSVMFTGEGSFRLPRGTIGRVRKVNQRTVSADFGTFGGSWRVDASLLDANAS